jgi:hypothetical protein
MDLQIDETDPRERTVFKDVKKLEQKGARGGAQGEVTEETLLKLVDYYQNKLIQTGSPSIGSVKSYLSALKAIHTRNGVDWRPVRESFLVLDKLKKMASDPGIDHKVRSQDYAVTLVDLELFCDSLDPNVHADLVAGALVSLLFWSLGRVHELLHAARYKRMRMDSVQEAESQITKRRTFRVFLERPKVRRAGEMQFLCPLRYLGKANPQLWMTLLLMSIANRGYEITSPWQIGQDMHATSKWLYTRMSTVLGNLNQKLGSSSFRAGGYTHMAFLGYELTLLRLFGRWSSDANDTYLRECPHILASAFAAKSRGAMLCLPTDAAVGPVAGSVWGRPSALGCGPLVEINTRSARLPSISNQDRILPRKRQRCDSGSKGLVEELSRETEKGSRNRGTSESTDRRTPHSGGTNTGEVVRNATFPQFSNSYFVSPGMTFPQVSNSFLSIPRRHDNLPQRRYFSS